MCNQRPLLIALVLVLTTLFVWPGAAMGQLAQPGSINLGPRVHLLEDREGRWTIEQIAGPGFAGGFRPSGATCPNLGYTSSVHWLRVPLHTPVDAGQPWLLEVGFSQLDHVRLYLPHGGGWVVKETGDLLPFSSRDVRHPNFVFRLPLRAEPYTAYLRIQSEGAVLLPLTLWRQDALLEHSLNEQLALGFYFAFLCAMAAYNLFVFASVRDAAYLYYVGYLMGFVLFQVSLTGHAAMVLWPRATWWSSVAAATCLAFALGSAQLFVRRMTNLRQVALPLHHVMGWVAASFGMIGVTLLAWYSVGIRIVTLAAALVVLLLPVPMLLAVRRGYRPARFVALAYAAILPGGILLVLRYLRLVESSFWVDHSVQIGTAVEAVLLSFALADRINLLGREKAEAQQARLEAEREAMVQQQSFSERLLSAQDAERRRIASEIHDGVGQNLLVITNQLGQLASPVAGQAASSSESIQSLRQLALETVRELRAVAHDLYPHKLDRLGLRAAARDVVEHTLRVNGIRYDCTIDEIDGLLPKAQEIHLYRIVQEGLSNVTKHAQADQVWVVITRKDTTIELTIEDDGRGLTGAPGMGLASMEHRAKLLGGTLSLAAREPTGLVLTVRVPIQKGSQHA